MQQPTKQPKRSIHFTPEEDQIIIDAVNSGEYNHTTGQYKGKPNLVAIARLLPNRTLRQVRDRWLHYLHNGTNTGPWTPAEDAELLKRYGELGAKWSKIALHLPGRSDNNIKARWMQLQRRQQNPNKKWKEEPSIHIAPKQSSKIADLLLENKSISEIANEIYGFNHFIYKVYMRIRMHILSPTFAQNFPEAHTAYLRRNAPSTNLGDATDIPTK